MTPQQERWLAAVAVIVGVLLIVGLLLASFNTRKAHT